MFHEWFGESTVGELEVCECERPGRAGQEGLLQPKKVRWKGSVRQGQRRPVRTVTVTVAGDEQAEM